MDKRMKAGRLVICLMLAVAMSVGIFDALGPDGPRTTFAQTDTTAPTVSSVAVTSDTGDDGVYGIGDDIEMTVTFSEDVAILGNPQLELTIGSSTRNAAYKSTTGSKVVFGYTVAIGDSDTDGISIAADRIDLKGGAIKNLSGNSADLSYSALSAQSGHKVDGIRPSITYAPYFLSSTFSTDGVHTTGEILTFEVGFSEDVVVSATPRLRLNLQSGTKYAELESRRGIDVTFDYQVVGGDLDLDGVAISADALSLNGGYIKDAVGNDAVLTHGAVSADSRTVIDAVPATVSSIAITSDPGSDDTYGVGDRIEVTVTFSESVRIPRRRCNQGGQTVTCMPRLALNIGGMTKIAKTHEAATITGTSVVFGYTIRDGDNDADGISVGANKLMLNDGSIKDDVGDGGEDANITHSAVPDDPKHKVGAPTTVSTAPSILSIAITSDADDDDYSYFHETIDRVPYALYDLGVYGIGDTVEVTVTFSESVTVTGSPQLELTVGNSSKTAAYSSTDGSKVIFTYTVAVGNSDSDGISISADKLTLNGGSIRDGADNDATLTHIALAAQSGHKVDGIRPTISSVRLSGANTFYLDGIYTIGEFVHADVTFSEDVTVMGVTSGGGYRMGDFKLALNIGGATRLAKWQPLPVNKWVDDRILFLYTVVNGDLDLNGASIAASSLRLNSNDVISRTTLKDGAGNDAILTHSAVADSSGAKVDGVPPTISSVSIISDPGSDDTYSTGDTISVTVTFSETVDVPRWQGTDENGNSAIIMPKLKLDVGGVEKIARLNESSGITSSSLVFRYTVRTGDSDSDGISIATVFDVKAWERADPSEHPSSP